MILFSLIILKLIGCATITKEDHQAVAISSEPPGATVLIDNFPQGKTPNLFLIKRKKGDMTVSFTLEGYHPQTIVLDKSINAFGTANLFLGMGAPIGAGVDYMTGKGTDYQERLHVILKPRHKSPQNNLKGSNNLEFDENNSTSKRELMIKFNKGEITKDKYLELTRELE